MKKLTLLTLALSSIFSTSYATTTLNQENVFIVHPMNLSPIEQHRVFLEHLTQNAKVLAQYDALTASLTACFPEKEIQSILSGIIFAADKHRFQTRKDPEQTPYIIHPMGVAYSLITIGQVRDADIVIAALLHDTVEDTDTSFDEIQKAHGARVANYVREVTDNKSLPKEVRKELQIKNAFHKSAGAAQIKLADKLYNLTDLANCPPADWEQERIDAYFTWAKAVVDGLPRVNTHLKRAVDQVIENHWK